MNDENISEVMKALRDIKLRIDDYLDDIISEGELLKEIKRIAGSKGINLFMIVGIKDDIYIGQANYISRFPDDKSKKLIQIIQALSKEIKDE